DFGVAKLLGGEVIAVRDEEITQWPRPLTPQYASPEQLRGGVISTTSDVYSLGVLLYKILTGQRPHDLEGLTLVEAIERVTTEPTPPSRVPTQAGRDTPPSAKATPSGLAGDLDAIVLKALRGDPDERYPSVEQLDADLGRHLEGFPVLARRGTVRYRATRFLRRHRVAVSLGTAAFVVLVAFGAYMAVMAERVSQEKGRLQEVMTFTLQIFRTAGPIGEYPQLSLREAVDRNAGLIDESFRDQPEIRAGVLEVLGDIYLDFGESERALELLEEARDLHATTYGPESVEYHRSLDRVGAALREMSRLDDSEASIQEALSWFREHTPNDAVRIVRSLNNLVDTYCYREDYGLAEAPSEEALRLAKRHLGGRSLDSAAATIQRAVVLRNTGRPAEASELYREGLKQYELAQGADHPYQATLLNNLSLIYRDQGQLDLAEGSLQKAEELYRASLGDRSVSRVRPALALATIAVHRGDRESAIERFRRAVQVAIDVDGHPFYPLRAGSDFARYLLETDRCEDGVDLMRASLERTRAETADYSPYFQLEGLLGTCLIRLGDSEEARVLIERSHRELVRLAPDNQDAIREAEEWIALLEGTPVTTGRQ
ncbi:MAG: tetratricopeptide repeat-containing protein kinase family protein, partial [Acidobacteriota bacterium]